MENLEIDKDSSLDLKSELRSLVGVFYRDPSQKEKILDEAFKLVMSRLDSISPMESINVCSRKILLEDFLDPKFGEKGYEHSFSREAMHAICEAFFYTQKSDKRKVELLGQCLRQVPARSRKLLKYHYKEGLGAKDISGKIGLATDNVYKTFSRIQRKLIECVNERLRDS